MSCKMKGISEHLFRASAEFRYFQKNRDDDAPRFFQATRGKEASQKTK